MRQLLPDVTTDTSRADSTAEIDPVELYRSDARPGTTQRPWVAINMVTSIDGATAVTGASAGLSSPADKLVFRTLRAIADVILVGAGTWRAEGYRPPRTSEADQAWRIASGRPAHPRIAVVSGRLDLDTSAPFFTDSPTRPLVITNAASDEDRRRALEAVADVIVAGENALDIGGALDQLGASGAEVVVCEGGPTLNEALLSASRIDELCLTISPLLAGGPSDRAIVGAGSLVPEALRLDRVLEDDGFLILRYTRDR
jgi:riboflavin biosynthesis pyrimidine reductase